MKKPAILIVAIVVIGLSTWHYRDTLFKSECDSLYEQYKIYLSSIDEYRYKTSTLHRWEVNEKLRSQQSAVAYACLSDNKPDVSIFMFNTLIAAENGPQFMFDKKLPRNAAQVHLVALHYGSLATAYEQAGDVKGKERALEKQKQYDQEAARMERRRQRPLLLRGE
jgi:hypothetical protein